MRWHSFELPLQFSHRTIKNAHRTLNARYSEHNQPKSNRAFDKLASNVSNDPYNAPSNEGENNKYCKRNNHHKRLLSQAITLKLFLCRVYTHRYVSKSIRVQQIKCWPNNEWNKQRQKWQTKRTIDPNSSWTNCTKLYSINGTTQTHAHTHIWLLAASFKFI